LAFHQLIWLRLVAVVAVELMVAVVAVVEKFERAPEFL
jgi:hypothetical protein